MAHSNHPESNISITNSYFSNNLAEMVACINAYQRQGTVHVLNNTFLRNSAITVSRVMIGSGSVIQASGTFTIVTSNSNLFFQNNAEYACVIGFFYGKFIEENSKFIGNFICEEFFFIEGFFFKFSLLIFLVDFVFEEIFLFLQRKLCKMFYDCNVLCSICGELFEFNLFEELC